MQHPASSKCPFDMPFARAQEDTLRKRQGGKHTTLSDWRTWSRAAACNRTPFSGSAHNNNKVATKRATSRRVPAKVAYPSLNARSMQRELSHKKVLWTCPCGSCVSPGFNESQRGAHQPVMRALVERTFHASFVVYFNACNGKYMHSNGRRVF